MFSRHRTPASNKTPSRRPERADRCEDRGDARLLATGALLVTLVAVLLVWFGAQTSQLEQRLTAHQAASVAAATLARGMGHQDARLRLRLSRVSTVQAALATAAASPAHERANAEAALGRRLEEVLGTPVEVAVSTESVASVVRLAAADQPRLVHSLFIGDAAVEIRQPCADLCSQSMPSHTSAVLRFGDRHWPLSMRDAPDDGDASKATAVARADVPHVGAVGWWVEVEQAAAPPHAAAVLAAALLLLIAGFGSWWIQTSSRARERTLMIERDHLAANQRKLEAVLDGTIDGILMVDAEDHISLVNPAAEVMFGHLEADVLGAPLTTLLPDADVDTASTAEHPRIYDCEAARNSGSERLPVRITERYLPLEDGPQRLLIVQDLTEQQHQVEQLRFLEQRDVITGLLNRTEFERRMTRLLADAVDSRASHVLCYIDIDQFKLINDTVGHAAGDALIAQLGKLIEVKFQEAALVGRLGGDEFGALFADRNEAEVLDLCEGLLQTVRNFLFTWRAHSYDVGVSIGVTAFEPQHESTELELARADVACHMAKMEGRNRIHVYRDSDLSLIRHHGEMHLVSRISEALSGGRFRLFAQPIVPLAMTQHGHSHYEILVRMLDEDGRVVAPGSFIQAAERYILMPAVDRWIVNELFSLRADELRQWHAEHPDEFLYAINVSGTSINDQGFLPYLKRQFELHRVPPASICFEITETAALRDVGHAREFMASLAELGCRFALDDFGSGLSSYGYLRELPVQFVKIDGTFVRDMHNNPVDYALVSSINQVAHVLGMKTIAEWVENEYVVNQLRVLNVDYVQGFAVGPPMPITPETDSEPLPGDGAAGAQEPPPHA